MITQSGWVIRKTTTLLPRSADLPDWTQVHLERRMPGIGIIPYGNMIPEECSRILDLSGVQSAIRLTTASPGVHCPGYRPPKMMPECLKTKTCHKIYFGCSSWASSFLNYILHILNARKQFVYHSGRMISAAPLRRRDFSRRLRRSDGWRLFNMLVVPTVVLEAS